MKFSMKKSNGGFSLIELLLVLGVIAILLVAAFVVYPQVRDKQIVNREVSALRLMSAGIQSLYASKRDYTDFTAVVLVNAKLVPEHMKDPVNGRPKAMSGGTIGTTVASDPARPGLGTSARVRILYPSVPERLCVAMAQGVAEFADETYVLNGAFTLDAAHRVDKTDDLSELVNNCSGSTALDKSYTLIFFLH